MLNFFPHFSIIGYSNSYIIGNSLTKEALVVDPGHFDVKMLQLIEKNDYYVKQVLITHSHTAHIQGLRTLLKIYDAEVFSGSKELNGIECNKMRSGDIIPALGTEIQSFSVPGHSRDSLIYIINRNIFTGDVLEAGRIGSTSNDFLKAQLDENIQSKIFSLKENYTLFPGHGPISTLEIEKMFNVEV